MNFTVKNWRTQHSFITTQSQSILTGALQANLQLPYRCQYGSCGTCRALLISGEIESTDYNNNGLPEEQTDQGYILLCASRAKSDLEIDIQELDKAIPTVKTIPSKIKSLIKLNHDVMQVILQLVPGQQIQPLPGQYIDILLSGNRKRSFSIASLSGDNEIELHIRLAKGGVFTPKLFNQHQIGDILRLYGPQGNFYYRNTDNRPIIMLAGGTGIAPIKALLMQIGSQKDSSQTQLYWGVRTESDLYLHEWLLQFNRLNCWLKYTPVISGNDRNWKGHRGLVHERVLDDNTDLSKYIVYASGPPAMIQNAQTAFTQAGLSSDNFVFDRFDFAIDTLSKINRDKLKST